MHASSSSDPDYNSISVHDLMVTIQENEIPTVTISAILTINEGGSGEISVSISHEPAQNVEITLAANLGEASISPGILTFTPGNWNIPKTANVTITNNTVYSGDRDLLVSYSAVVSNTNNPYHGILKSNTTITIIEDDPICSQPGAGAEDDFTPNITGEDYGEGTESDPYIICNADQLQSMRDHLDAHYELGQNIDASSINGPYACNGTCTGFQPIGNCGDNGKCFDYYGDEDLDNEPFTGALDGKEFTISNLTINISRPTFVFDDSYAGLFGYTSGANIRNVGLLNVDIDASSDDFSSAGGLVGLNSNSSSITNSYSTGDVSSSSSVSDSYAGGLVAQNSSSIINSYATGNVSSSTSLNFSNSSAGGLVGQNNGSITNSYSTGNVSSSSADSSSVGGVVGFNKGSITNSYYD